MNIQRKYSLPNCTLLLEGLNDTSRAANYQEMRPELSILVNAECYLSGLQQPLAGGREFFESLVRTVNAYAQQFLSNVSNPVLQTQDTEIVQIYKIDSNRHKLIVNSETSAQSAEYSASGATTPVELELNTVQLFDLVEAVDQFFADSQTLPEVTLALQSVSRRYAGTSQALMKQAVPASVGLTSLAAAAIAFSLIPVPQPKASQVQSQQETNTTNLATDNSTNNVTPLTSTSPIAETPTPIATNVAIATPETTPNPTTTPGTTPVTADIEALIKTVPEITDPSQLRALNRQVYNQVSPVWEKKDSLSEDAVFRVGVAADGAIVGYKAVNKSSNDQISKVPLPNLLYNPATRPPVTNEAIAQFRVVFRKGGVLEVSPWLGYAKTPQVIGEKIKDPAQVKDLNTKLYDKIRTSWSGTPTFSNDLKYRVAVNKDGVIADYEPLNRGAFDFYRETPLPKMFQEIYGSNVAAPNNKEALAHYEVTFKPGGNLDIKPWQGYK
ncbi:DUF4335 domain-containing protein [Brunnivagina elsteri]|uniref:DUF4335 domain-containing protein n=1 Tax=Brunnivagina elsteri CCALA 953 TaxID=987040 RepID=A0A2A2TKJ7_9CYAN|nr:DUF4335 domain-containing protein [Calothrix elsteri]PAX56551.1 hypothetical protein CK510_10065 [Calothrix elsteri CCALA 953]